MKRLLIFLALSGLALFAAALRVPFPSEATSAAIGSSRALHPTYYRQEAGHVEQSIKNSGPLEPIALDQVIGAVVPHHIPVTIPLLTAFYARLAKTQPSIDTFIIVGPDHFEKGRADISISSLPFETPFGILKPNLKIITALIDKGYVVQDETPFDDHSIHSQLLFIKRFFPDATIVPIVFRSSSTNEAAETLGKHLAPLMSSNTVVVASVDFSHYLYVDQARPLDEQSARNMLALDPKIAGLSKADSPQSLTAMMAAVKVRGANTAIPVGVYNTADFTNNRDNTTGYVLQYYGIKK